MRGRNRLSVWVASLLLGAFAHLLTAAPAAAQCILCYTSAAGTGNRGIRSLQIGILILLIPSVAFMAGLVWVMIRRRHGAPLGTDRSDRSEMDAAWEERFRELHGAPGTEGLPHRG